MKESVNTAVMSNGTLQNPNISKLEAIEILRDQLMAARLQVYIPAIVYTVVLMLGGFIGNTIVCIVYYWRWKHVSTRIFILSLATVDLINCVITMPTEIAVMVDTSGIIMGLICKLSRFSTYLCNAISTMVLIAVAVDRYQRICCPHTPVMTSERALHAVAFTIIIAMAIAWPALILYGSQTLEIPFNNTTVKFQICLIEDRYVQTMYPLAYFAFQGILTILVFVSFIILYTFVGIKVHRQWTFRKKSMLTRNSPTSENGARNCLVTSKKCGPVVERSARTTAILSVVTFSYVISFLPFLVIAIHRTFYPSFWTIMSREDKMVYQVCLRSYLLNCAINPIIYSFLNGEFRKRCGILFRHGLSKFIRDS